MKQINQLKAGTMLSYVNLVISCIIPVLYTPVMLRILGQAEYGLYSLSNSVSGYLSLLQFGIGSAVIRYVTRCRAENRIDDVRRTMGLFITIYSCLAVLVCIGGMVLIQLAGSMFGKGLTSEEIAKLRILLVIMTANTAISFPVNVFASIAVCYERYVFHKVVGFIETLAAPVLNLIVLFAGFGSVGLAMISVPVQIVNGLVYGCYCARRLKVYPVFRKMPVHLLKELVVFSMFVFLSSLVDMLYWATDKVLIGAAIGSVAVAVYNVGGTFTSMLQNMVHAISGVFSPRVNILVAQNAPKRELSDLLIRVGRLQYLVTSLLLSGYVVFGQSFIKLWAGPEYEEAYYIALLTMIPLAVPLIQSIAFATILAENKHRFRSIIYAVIAVLNLVSTWLVLPYYGIIGAAICTAASFLMGQCIIMNIYYYRITKLDIPSFWKNIARMSIVPGGMIVAGILLLKYLPINSLVILLLGAVVYSLIFAVFSWLISMNRYEKDLVLGLVRKVLPKR